jgi:hypothetical protein
MGSNTDIELQLQRYLTDIKVNSRLGIINVVSRLIVSQVENVSKEVKTELNSYEVKFELYKKVLWKTLYYILNIKNTYSSDLLSKLFEAKDVEAFVNTLKLEMQNNPYFSLDFIEGAFMVLRDLLPISQKTHKFVPTTNTTTKEMTLEEKREMAAKLLNLLESEVEANPKIPVDITADKINVEENRNELDQGILSYILKSATNSPKYLEISMAIYNLAGLITGNLDPNDLIPDFVPISDKTKASLMIDVLISETNKIRHMLPGETVGLREFN